MEANHFLGLIKFFRDDGFLDKLIEGCFFCKTPESFRLDKLEGVSDMFESCTFSYRVERDDRPINVTVAGKELDELVSLTVHRGNDHDSWLHCWMSLRVPKDSESLEQLISDVKRIKSEFGGNYAFIPASKLDGFVSLLKQISDKPLWCNEVTYSADRNLWSSECKAVEYSYQREYRFGFGHCSPSEVSPYIINYNDGFQEFILKNPEVKLQSPDGRITFFNLSSEN